MTWHLDDYRCTLLRGILRRSFQETSPRNTAENTAKHRGGGVGSVVANHRGGSETSMVVTTLLLYSVCKSCDGRCYLLAWIWQCDVSFSHRWHIFCRNPEHLKPLVIHMKALITVAWSAAMQVHLSLHSIPRKAGCPVTAGFLFVSECGPAWPT